MQTNNDLLHSGSKHTFYVAPGVWGLKTVFVNLYFIKGETVPGETDSWVLVDAGIYGSAGKIKQAAEELFGKYNWPKAIILTHGHFDHVGALKELAIEWDVPVYAHHMELPYLTGLSSYPPPDPSVGRGGMAYLSFMYPKKPIDITSNLELLPNDGSVPGLPEWKWVETPGHTPGHVSFFREKDRVLLAGDAFITRHGESMLSVVTQKKEVHGPPSYFTPDWISAQRSVEKLASIQPEIAATGHGLPMQGPELREQLTQLAANFRKVAVPAHGRYVSEPAIANEQGLVSVPPPVSNPVNKTLLTVGLLSAAGVALMLYQKQRNNAEARKKVIYHNRPTSGAPFAVTIEEDIPNAYTNNYP
ncbi:MBL fold metallo-hydrolase [Pontibacter qinzhouensis]|uniref:MBL fold metallo-hydrolase n=1 Tax=Pontibacter qinzhouensis TaxID=2603253 RepID=A0A5C8KAS7_9BACT|nr:MBL fold metallo-hydrolase [Pontibacter qinzhouensis]TXK49654.1 MBL fold metallo-hydrolase [Pontibacter qinzhouensis]